jgi:hypothetical protein
VDNRWLAAGGEQASRWVSHRQSGRQLDCNVKGGELYVSKAAGTGA